MNYTKILVLSLLCSTSFLSYSMETKPTQEVIKAANSRLLHASQTGNLAEVTQLIAEGIADTNALNDNQSTPLMLAANKGYKDIVECLINAGAHVNAINKYGSHALIFASHNNHTALAQTLIKAGANVNIIGYKSKTALEWAVKNRNSELVNALIDAQANINVYTEDCKTLLRLALETFNDQIIQTLVDNGSTQKDDALLLAADIGYCHAINILIKASADINVQDTHKCTPLMLACARNNTAVAIALIEADADVNMVDQDDETALIYAVTQNNADIVTALINARAKINICDKDNETLLNVAIKSGNDQIVQILVDHGSTQKNDALLLAADLGCYNAVNILIKAGANVNVQTRSNTTPLMYSCKKNNTNVAMALIKAGADLNVLNKSGESALSLAIAFHKRPEIYMALINPIAKDTTRKKIETLLMIYNTRCSQLSELPPELLQIIITYAHPEFAMDHQLISRLHPHDLVDTIPLEDLAMFIKNGTLNQETILDAWQKKILSIVQSLKIQKKVDDNTIQKFETDALTKVTISLT